MKQKTLLGRNVVIKFTKRAVILSLATVFLSLAPAAPVFPVKYSANKRYLVDQNGTPFPIMGRTVWFLTSLSVADYRTLIDDTAARGYSAIEFHVVNHDPRGKQPPFGGNGDRPFLNRLNGTAWNGSLTYGDINTEAPDFTTPNEAYWSLVDGLLAYCESKGILAFMFPAYVGYTGTDQGWMQELVANGTTKMQSYGAWIATRYKNQKNLVWMMGGDMGTPPNTFTTAQTSVESALLTGLKSVTGQQSVLFSAEWNSESIATDQVNFGTSMTLNGVYSWTGAVNSHGRRAYAYSPVEPAFLLEEPYDEAGQDGTSYNPSATQPVRRFQWWGWLSTIGGYISGNAFVMWFRTDNGTVDWRNHLDTQGTRDMTRLNAFMGSIAWYNLVPSGLNGMRTLITAGGSSVSASDYVTAAATPDGTLLVAYVPPAHSGSITVDMGAMSGPTRARWFDPTSAAYTSIGTGLANNGTRSFTPPGNNSAGAPDWVLVLDNTTGNSPAPPTISDIPNQSTTVSTATPAIPFTINDADTPANNLTLSKGSSNPTLVPANNIVFGGSGSSRTVTVTPAANQTGSTTITVTVSDGSLTASDSFVLTVGALATGNSTSFTSATTITIPDQGAATPYPSTINVSGLSGAVNNVTVTLRNLTQTWASDVDVLLVGPSGQKVMLMSDVGSGNANNVTLTFSDAAAAALPASGLASGTFRPTNLSDSSPGGDNFPLPAPAGPYATTLSAFNGTGANGAWSLYVFDDGPGDLGSFAGGWSLTVTTTSATGSATPTISNIPDQATTVNTATAAIAFTINDPDTSANNLTLSKGSSNPTLVPANNIVFGGSGSSRTVTVTPAANQTGSATITVTVSDGSQTASDTFVVTVNAAAPNGVVRVNAGGGSFTDSAGNTWSADTGFNTGSTYSTASAINNTVNDALYQTERWDPSTSPALTYSFNVPNGNYAAKLHFAETYSGNFGIGRRVFDVLMEGALVVDNLDIYAQVGANSALVITVPVTVNDGQLNIQFVHGVDNPKVSAIEVLPASGTPTISNIPDQATTVNTATAAIPFTINDADTPVNNLTVSKGTSNPTLVPANNIVFGGSGSSRTVTVTPAANQTGSATITVTVSDGSNGASDTFVLTVNAAATGTVTASFNNPAAITIPDQGAATPYPSTINVSGLSGTISIVTVALRNLSHTWASDVDVLLVGPAGQKVMLMSDAGNGNANNVTLTLSDAAAAALPASGLASGTFKPTNLSDNSSGGDNFPAPAPAGPYATTLATFNGQPANGTWSLYVMDDGSGDQGSFAGGWSLTITTAGAAARSSVLVEEPPRITSIMIGDQGAVRVTVSGVVGLSYALETSSDLLSWTKAEVLENLTGSVEFSEQPTTNAVRFYRAVSIPK